eukprot:Nitzschia sp. Nitz4//scaffold109_size72162//44298//45861//NITZ4_005850-RA/size72162-processed-gene-0.16-mRNA-1//1//CDS//3329532775//385//frame0
MTGKSRLQERVRGLMEAKENQTCIDCFNQNPNWVTLILIPPGPHSASGSRIGAFCCFQCAGAHRALGGDICVVKSVELETFREREVECLESGGNTKVNLIFEAKIQDVADKARVTSFTVREDYVKQKYENLEYFDAKALSRWTNTISPNSTVHPENRPRSRRVPRRSSMPMLMSPKWETGPENATGVRIGELPRISPSNVPPPTMPPKPPTSLSRSRSNESAEGVRPMRRQGSNRNLRNSQAHSGAETSGIPRQLVIDQRDSTAYKSRRRSRSRRRNPSVEHRRECSIESNHSGTIERPEQPNLPPQEEVEVPDLTLPFQSGRTMPRTCGKPPQEPQLISRLDNKTYRKPLEKEPTRQASFRKRSEARRRRRNRDDALGSSLHSLNSEESMSKGSRRSHSLEDSFREIVSVLEKEDEKHEVSMRTGRRMMYRRRSLMHMSQKDLSVDEDMEVSQPSQTERSSQMEMFLDNLMSPEKSRIPTSRPPRRSSMGV